MKKTIYVFCCFLGIFAVSCATQPKEEKIPEIPDTEIQEEPEKSSDFSDESEPESFESLEEKIEDESLPDLPEPERSEENLSGSEDADGVPFYPVEEELISGDENLFPEEGGFSGAENLSETQNEQGSVSGEEENISGMEEDVFGGVSDSSDDISDNISGGDSLEGEIGSDDETEEISEEDETENAEENEETGTAPVPSRSMSVQRNRQIDIVYPGKGWVYQGTLDENGNTDTRNRYFVFGGRKLGGEDTTFTVRSRIPGKYLLHFYKSDVLSGTYIDDYLEVLVENEAASDSSHVQAPLYKEAVPKKPERRGNMNETGQNFGSGGTDSAESSSPIILDGTESSSSFVSGSENGSGNVSDGSVSTQNVPWNVVKSSVNPENVSGTSENGSGISRNASANSESGSEMSYDVSAPGVLSAGSEMSGRTPQELLKEAENAFSSKKYQEALSLSDEYLSVSDTGIDEGIFLKAQILEAKSPVQNIKESVRLYDLLLETYPQSRLWDKANERSIYLKRMYINIR